MDASRGLARYLLLAVSLSACSPPTTSPTVDAGPYETRCFFEPCSPSDAGTDAGCPDGGCHSAVDGGCSSAWKLDSRSPVFRYSQTALDGIPGDPSIVRLGNEYVMFYGAVRGDFTDPLLRIFRTTSPDGIAWQRSGTAVLLPSGILRWDGTNVETPFVLQRPDNTWVMYYSGNATSSDVGFQIGLATSQDTQTWTRVGSAPVLSTTADELSLIGPSVLFEQETNSYTMLYGAILADYTIEIRKATSSDGLTWQRQGTALRMDAVERQSSGDLGVMGPELLKTPLGYELVYNSLISPVADGGMPRSGGIYYARSPDLTTWTKHTSPVYSPSGGSRFDGLETGAQSWLKTEAGYRLWYVGTNTDYASFYDSGLGVLDLACP